MGWHRDGMEGFFVLRALHIALFILLGTPFCDTSPLGAPPTAAVSTALIKRGDTPPLVPPGSNTADPATFISFYEPACSLGLWSERLRNDDMRKYGWKQDAQWEGHPFGDNFPPDQCVNVKDLQSNLDNSITAYRVTGYCECTFFDKQDCDGPLFAAFNREDGALDKNGPDNDRISSFKCSPRNGYDVFQEGQVKLSYYGGTGLDVNITKNDIALWKEEPYGELVGISHTVCYNMPEGFKLSTYWLRGVTCRFYKSSGCPREDMTSQVGNAGVQGWRRYLERLSLTRSFEPKSFRCFLPFGIETPEWPQNGAEMWSEA
ncbi:hypothetical protein Dda_7489 [Drechslerella dactyloides]|uniref:Uncharacterized protein n=1 Tax=Drechslerella dactyloides TaxID=74499 RepID=A0AAD6IVT3_DREDA|nr:hypothetical protein Dda_7489 [Drechslerella dactyloides]